MHRTFSTFIDQLWNARTDEDFASAMATTSSALDLPYFAYLALQNTPDVKPRLISTYPAKWTAHYLEQNYGLVDPVVLRALRRSEPFHWGIDVAPACRTPRVHRLFEEAARYGICVGYTVPIHDRRRPVAALTFACDQQSARFASHISSCSAVLQLIAYYFHAHIHRNIVSERSFEGVTLSRREIECLEWASLGKSAWEVGAILGLSRNTVASYLDSAKRKLKVRTVTQAALRLAAAKSEKQN